MTRYTIDPERSRVWVDATSSLHSIHSQTAGVEGTFEAEMRGPVQIDPAVTPRARIELAVGRLSSGNPLYDREMRRRIDARTYPLISGQLTGMQEGSVEGTYVVAGDVTFRGVTRAVVGEMTLSAPDDRTVVLEGSHLFDIRDFGMVPPRILTLRVHPEVSVRVELVAVAAPGRPTNGPPAPPRES
jgi:polyisoprenoid-binding protein YceI